jgi:hypothetical protein
MCPPTLPVYSWAGFAATSSSGGKQSHGPMRCPPERGTRLNAITSGLLVATFAAAAYANHHGLIPGLWRERRYAVYAAALLLVTALLAWHTRRRSTSCMISSGGEVRLPGQSRHGVRARGDPRAPDRRGQLAFRACSRVSSPVNDGLCPDPRWRRKCSFSTSSAKRATNDRVALTWQTRWILSPARLP